LFLFFVFNLLICSCLLFFDPLFLSFLEEDVFLLNLFARSVEGFVLIMSRDGVCAIRYREIDLSECVRRIAVSNTHQMFFENDCCSEPLLRTFWHFG